MFEEFNFALLDDPNFKEDSVREELIVPLLKKLGYKVGDRANIIRGKTLERPFCYIGTKKNKINIIPDYILEIDNVPKWILDAKAPGEKIETGKNVEQAYSYSMHPDIRTNKFALCNGRKLAVFHVSKKTPELVVNLSEIDDNVDQIMQLLSPNAFNEPYNNFAPFLSTVSFNFETTDVQNKLAKNSIEYGVTLRESGRIPEAVGIFLSTLKDCKGMLEDADIARIYTNLGAAYYDIGKINKSKQYLSNACSLMPGNMQTHLNLAILSLRTKKYAKAIGIINAAIQDLGETAQALTIYAAAVWDRKQDIDSMKIINRAIEMEPSFSSSHLLRGLILRSKNEIDQALIEFSTATLLDKKNYFAHAILYETEAHLALAGRSNIDINALDRNISICLHQIINLATSVPLSMQVNTAILYSAQGLLFAAKKEWEQSIQAFENAIQYENNPGHHQNLGTSYLKLHEYEQAALHFHTALNGGMENVDLLFNLGLVDIHLLEDQQGSDINLLYDAKNCLKRLKTFNIPEGWVEFLDAIIIIAESKCRKTDMGLGKAKALLEQIFRNLAFSQDQAVEAHLQYQEAERVQRCVEDAKY